MYPFNKIYFGVDFNLRVSLSLSVLVADFLNCHKDTKSRRFTKKTQ